MSVDLGSAIRNLCSVCPCLGKIMSVRCNTSSLIITTKPPCILAQLSFLAERKLWTKGARWIRFEVWCSRAGDALPLPYAHAVGSVLLGIELEWELKFITFSGKEAWNVRVNQKLAYDVKCHWFLINGTFKIVFQVFSPQIVMSNETIFYQYYNGSCILKV